MINEVVDEKRLLLVRTFSATLLVGHSDITDEELGSGKPVYLQGFRQMLSMDIPQETGRGISVRQINQVIPLALCEGPVNIHTNVDYWVVPDKRASMKISELLANIGKAEMEHRAREAGIVLPGSGTNDG